MKKIESFRMMGYLVLLLCLPYESDSQSCDPCTCLGQIADCANRSLSHIPSLNPEIKILNLTGNNFSAVSEETFRSIANLTLISLDMSSCEIFNITSNALSAFNSLEFLNMSSNYIHGFQRQSFCSLTQLKSLDLSDNQIKKMNIDCALSVSVLNLRMNTLYSFPKFCFPKNTTTTVPNLKELDLSGNLIAFPNFIADCFPALETLSLSYNPIRIIRSHQFYYLQNLQYLYLDNLFTINFIFEPRAFSSKSLLKLNISDDDSLTSVALSTNNAFESCDRLQALDMSYIELTDLSHEKIDELFGPLKELRTLVLRGAGLGFIPSVISRMKHLTSLSLECNYLGKWNPDIFKNVSLRSLSLEGNKISHIDKATFPEEFLHNIESISLGYNPFACTCDIYWFLQWIKYNKEKLVGYPYKYTCYSPPEMYGMFLDDYDPSYFQCHPLANYQIALVVLGGILLFTIVISVFLVRYKWHIKYFMYSFRSKRGYDAVSMEDSEFIYDAFVAYCLSDRSWVISHLMSILEGQENFKLCLHERDFLPGRTIIEQLSETIKRSRKVILVLSNEFAKSTWCQYEILMAQARLLEDGANVLILVSIENINSKYMTDCLCMLMKTLTHFQWEGRANSVKRQVFWKKLVSALK